jgi:hypothetical protein
MSISDTVPRQDDGSDAMQCNAMQCKAPQKLKTVLFALREKAIEFQGPSENLK